MRIKKVVSIVMLAAIVAAVYFLSSLFLGNNNSGNEPAGSTDDQQVRCKVMKIVSEEQVEDPMSGGQSYMLVQKIELQLLEGEYKEKTVIADNTISEMLAYNLIVKEEDEVLAYLIRGESGEIIGAGINEIVRDKYLLILGIIFVLALIILGGLKGFKSVVTLSLTGIIVIKVMFPLILRGYSPLTVTITACIIITLSTLVIINGFNKKTFNAAVGTIGGVLIAGATAYIIGSLSNVTGLGEQEAQMLISIPQNIKLDYKGILFAGIIMGALGAVMDVGMSIASSMYEIEAAKPDIKSKELIKSGMNVGRDIMGTMSNTLILAYAGGSINLILLFLAYNINVISIINMDMIASEIIRALAGSIGLVFTIPITALVSGIIGRRKNV